MYLVKKFSKNPIVIETFTNFKKKSEMMKSNILFLLIDSFRADKCCGDSKTSVTPHMDSLIENGMYFEQTIGSVDGTTLSLNSIFTSLYPYRSEIRIKKLYSRDSNFIHILNNFGYHVYGVMPDLTSFSSLANYCENKDSTYNAGPPSEHLWDGLGQRIIDILQNKKMKEPWIFFIHLFDLHWPLVVPKEYDNESYGESKYERVVSAIDFWIGKILEKIDLKDTLVVLTADHGALIPVSDKGITDFEPDLTLGLKLGKSLMPKFTHPTGSKFFIFLRTIVREMRLAKANRKLTPCQKRSRLPYFTRSLYDESIRVPLIFVGNGINHKIISQQVSTIDIFPTVAEIVGLQIRKESIQGRSLVPLFQGKKFDELPVYIQSMPYETISSEDVIGLRTFEYKYFRDAYDATKKVNLYNLKNDPQENNNIAQNHPEIVKEMERILTEIIKYAPVEHEQEEISDEETKKIQQELKKLGYM